MKDNTKTLTLLGNKKTEYKFEDPNADMLEIFENKYPHRDYVVSYTTKEFTSLCPVTGQPDFAEIKIEYIPDKYCIETKSLKLYLFAYRNYGSFMETITNKILEDCVKACNPRKMTVYGNFNARGGITINVVATYEREE